MTAASGLCNIIGMAVIASRQTPKYKHCNFIYTEYLQM